MSPMLLTVQFTVPVVAPTTTVPKLLLVVPDSAAARCPVPVKPSAGNYNEKK